MTEYAEFGGDAQLPYFGPVIHFFMKFGPKSQNCLFEMKRGIYNNSNNTLVMFSWPVLDQTYTFWANSVRKIEIVYFLPWCMTFAK